MHLIVLLLITNYCYFSCLGCISTVSPEDLSTTSTMTTTTTLVPCVCPNLDPPVFAPIEEPICPVPLGFMQTRPMFIQVSSVPPEGQCAIQMTCEMYFSTDDEQCVLQQSANTLIVCIADEDDWTIFIGGVDTTAARRISCLTPVG